jgi:hypothetical protein
LPSLPSPSPAPKIIFKKSAEFQKYAQTFHLPAIDIEDPILFALLLLPAVQLSRPVPPQKAIARKMAHLGAFGTSTRSGAKRIATAQYSQSHKCHTRKLSRM